MSDEAVDNEDFSGDELYQWPERPETGHTAKRHLSRTP